MKRLLFLSELNKEQKKLSLFFSPNLFQIDWNTVNSDASYYAIFVVVQQREEVFRILEKYKNLPFQQTPSYLIYTEGNLKDYYEDSLPFQSIFSETFLSNFSLKTETRKPDGVFFKVKNRLEKIIFEDITWIQAKDIYAIIKTNNARYLVSHTLGEIDEKLKPFQLFQRIHRSYIVNLSKIEAIEDRNALVAGEYLPIGQAYREDLFAQLFMI